MVLPVRLVLDSAVLGLVLRPLCHYGDATHPVRKWYCVLHARHPGGAGVRLPHNHDNHNHNGLPVHQLQLLLDRFRVVPGE